WDNAFGAVEHAYGRLLHVSLPHRWIVIAIGLATFVAGIALPMSGAIGTDIFPSGDQSEIDITMLLPSGTSLAATNAATLEVERELMTHTDIEPAYSIVVHC